MTEPVQVDTAAQYGYQHAQQEQDYGGVFNLHRNTSFLKCKKIAPEMGAILQFIRKRFIRI